MDWSKRLESSLPTPQADEPESLRQDIADELADHLQCALRRQLLNTRDAEQARREVIERFGDPEQVARQLWFDALKEKLMTQRIVLAIAALLAVVCLAAVMTVWIVVEQGRAATRALLAEHQAATEKNRAANEALVAEVLKLSQAAKPIDWKPPLEVHLVTDEIGGPPAAGYKVVLRTRGEGPSREVAEHVADAEGFVSFGPLRPLDYSLNVIAPWGEMTGRSVDHVPGEVRTEVITCPAAPPDESAKVRITVERPDDLRDEPLWLICYFSADNATRAVIDQQWYTPPDINRKWLVVRPDGNLVDMDVERGQPYSRSWISFTRISPGTPNGDHGLRVDLRVGPNQEESFFGLSDDPAKEQIARRPGRYRLYGLIVAGSPQEVLGTRRLKTFGGQWTESTDARRRGAPSATLDIEKSFVEVSKDEQPTFEAIEDQSTEWKISLPDEVWSNVRQRQEELAAKE